MTLAVESAVWAKLKRRGLSPPSPDCPAIVGVALALLGTYKKEKKKEEKNKGADGKFPGWKLEPVL